MHKNLAFVMLLFGISAHTSGLLTDIEQAITSGNTLVPLILACIAGFLTSLSPCVYPLIPITLSIMGARTYQNHLHGFLVASTYVFGMSVTYSLLGALFAYVGILMGAILQNPLMLLGISLLFILFGLSSLGVFKIVIPQRFMGRLTRIGGMGFKGAFLMGLVAGLLAAPCTGPVLGFILTLIASHKDVWLGIALMVAFSAGLGLPFLLLGTFSSALTRMPKSGRFLYYGNIILGVVMLGTGLYYAKLAFPKASVEKIHTEGFFIIDDKTTDQTLFDRLLAQASAQQKPVLLDFYADWCAACLQLDTLTFSDDKVKKALTNFMVIKIDSSRSSDYLVSIQNRFNVTGLPTIVFIDQNGSPITTTRILGFLSADSLLDRLSTILTP